MEMNPTKANTPLTNSKNTMVVSSSTVFYSTSAPIVFFLVFFVLLQRFSK